MIGLAVPFFLLLRGSFFSHGLQLAAGGIGSLVSLLPHELLHAACYKAGCICTVI